MGAGGPPREAPFTLAGPIPAGAWTFVGDGIIIEPADVTFELIWRVGQEDTILATWEHHFEPWPIPPDGGPRSYDAVLFDVTENLAEVPARAGDQLVLRYRADSAGVADAYIPNGHGEAADGRFPHLVLPR